MLYLCTYLRTSVYVFNFFNFFQNNLTVQQSNSNQYQDYVCAHAYVRRNRIRCEQFLKNHCTVSGTWYRYGTIFESRGIIWYKYRYRTVMIMIMIINDNHHPLSTGTVPAPVQYGNIVLRPQEADSMSIVFYVQYRTGTVPFPLNLVVPVRTFFKIRYEIEKKWYGTGTGTGTSNVLYRTVFVF